MFMDNSKTSELPCLPLRQSVGLPGTRTSIPIGRDRSLALVRSLEVGDHLALVVQHEARVEDPAIADVHPIGVSAVVCERKIASKRRASLQLHVQHRIAIESLSLRDGLLVARCGPVEEVGEPGEDIDALANSLREFLRDLAPDATVKQMLEESHEPGVLADRVAHFIDMPHASKVKVLRELDVTKRLRLVAHLLQEARARAEMRERIDSEVRRGLNDQQREVLLRQQLKAIRKQLGDDADDESQNDTLRKKLDEADLPEEVQTVTDRELRRLGSMQPGQPEGHVIRNYLELIAELPWNKRAETSQDIDGIGETLEADHYGLDEVKRRILEHMAVLKLSAKAKGTILALVGPPGVGKTSLAQSVAHATGRPLARVSLGGVRDEAELRGHRRTYVGAMPGRIVTALRKAGVKNPVMVLDEVDKLGRGWAGDPEAALLEVLDPEQNVSFTDHYLDVPFDLSEVLFIATANEVSSLSPPLRDRLEIIEVSGYTVDEKTHIATEHLWPKKLEEHGLDDDQVTMERSAVSLVISEYTREAGVRQLGRELAKICRSVALDVARKGQNTRAIKEADVREVLGRPKFFNEAAERTQTPGVAAGLAWTPVGGDILYVETTRMPGTGKIEITGQLGSVMTESARAALAYLRTHAEEIGADAHFLEKHDLHVHVPAGGVPKDGPSAGVTMFTALASLLSGRQVRSDTAMTGEATLRGRVLPVGGIKSKFLAAHRAGFKRIILPKRNERDLEDVPDELLEEVEIVLAEDMTEVLDAALEPESSAEMLEADHTAQMRCSEASSHASI